MGCVDNSDRMGDSYSMSRRTFKWPTKLFFHFLDLTVLNSWTLLPSYGTKYTHRDFRLVLVRNLIEEAGKSQDRPTSRLVGRPSSGAKNVLRVESLHNQHWPAKSSTQLHCRLCSSRGQRKGTIYRVSQEERTKLREGVPYVKLYRYNPKHLYPKLNGYGDNGKRSLKI